MKSSNVFFTALALGVLMHCIDKAKKAKLKSTVNVGYTEGGRLKSKRAESSSFTNGVLI